MKRYLLIVLIILTALSLTGCLSNRNPNLNMDLTNETWMRQVETNPNRFAIGADSWFMTGDPNAAEEANRDAPYSAAISTMQVRVPNFANIKVNGDFQVQLFGTDGNNTVNVYGPNAGVREVAITVRGTTLFVNQTKNAPNSMRRVIIRIGINCLNNLIYAGGCATIEGIRLRSNGLAITTLPGAKGNIYLSGYLNMRCISHAGSGFVNVFGANSGGMDIKTFGGGAVNVCGNVNLRSITHHGNSNINVIGALPGCRLRIYADGRGKIGLKGHVNIAEVKARDYTCVYAYGVTSNYIYAYACDHARIGLAGYTTDLFVNTTDSSIFAGRYLCARNAYVRAHDWSHINVAATDKIFAAATQNASVYFYGSPDLMSQFVSGNGTVIPIWSAGRNYCVNPPRPRPSYKGEVEDYKGEHESHRRHYHARRPLVRNRDYI